MLHNGDAGSRERNKEAIGDTKHEKSKKDAEQASNSGKRKMDSDFWVACKFADRHFYCQIWTNVLSRANISYCHMLAQMCYGNASCHYMSEH